MKSTDSETLPKDDLAGFKPAPPQHRIDDKAAVLEKEVQSLKSGFNRERFLYLFVIQCLFIFLVAPSMDNKEFVVLLVTSLLFSIGLGKFLDFPWIGHYLERWHDLLFDACKRWASGKEPLEVEPAESDADQPTRLSDPTSQKAK